MNPEHEIDEFLNSGDYDPLFIGFPGDNHIDRMNRGHDALAEALVAEVQRRESQTVVAIPCGLPSDIAKFTRGKVEPMVRGLFRRDEVEPVLGLLENSVVFLVPGKVTELLRSEGLGTAWEIANIYLRSLGAEPISDQAPQIVGLSTDTKCYVSMEYFRDESPFADYVVHEVAHVFHNTKRRIAGLPETRRRVWLLPIEYRKRETFAYACEAFSCIRARGKRPADRRELLAELVELPQPPDERVEPSEYYSVLSEAVACRNGWKKILERCSAAT